MRRRARRLLQTSTSCRHVHGTSVVPGSAEVRGQSPDFTRMGHIGWELDSESGGEPVSSFTDGVLWQREVVIIGIGGRRDVSTECSDCVDVAKLPRHRTWTVFDLPIDLHEYWRNRLALRRRGVVERLQPHRHLGHVDGHDLTLMLVGTPERVAEVMHGLRIPTLIEHASTGSLYSQQSILVIVE